MTPKVAKDFNGMMKINKGNGWEPMTGADFYLNDGYAEPVRCGCCGKYGCACPKYATVTHDEGGSRIMDERDREDYS